MPESRLRYSDTIFLCSSAHLPIASQVSYAAALAQLRECCNDKKLGSKAKHAVKDLALFRLGHPAVGVLLLQLLVQVSYDEKSLGKDERKIGAHVCVCRCACVCL